ncbi:MAG: MBL fold metallo-hydrolase [Sedimentisphaerales bacterium]|nr:MBL fold metallo-hydrolase [Sedimentisphaerales bacterium]
MQSFDHVWIRPARAVVTVALIVACAGRSGAGELPAAPTADIDGNEIVDLVDYACFARHWTTPAASVDLAPDPNRDGLIDAQDLAVLAEHWLDGATSLVHLQWFGHASVKIWSENAVVYVDPRNLPNAPHDATVVCVTHSHGDHYAPADIAKVWQADSIFVAPPDVVAAHGTGEVVAPGDTLAWPGLSITGVPAYNTNKPNHPRSNNWLGYIVEIGSKRVYVAGDTDLIPEMSTLEDIDVAILPAGGTYTMTATEAAEATARIQPRLAVPYHWGEIVGTTSDAARFARLAASNAKVMASGEVLGSRDWNRDFSLVALWSLNEQEGDVVSDWFGSAGAVLHGTPQWQPTGGVSGGAVHLDGEEDYISTDLILNPADGPFSVFAWVKTEAPGVIVSQKDGANWLCLDATTGYLGTELRGNGRASAPLWSQTPVTDGDWHRVGLTWDGAAKVLYVDDVEVARSAETVMRGLTTGLYLGAGADLDPATFFTGLIDDVRVHVQAVTP